MKFDWIFFDCFNTLIDDFDKDGDESGMKPIAHIPAEDGFFPSSQAFHKAYIRWRVDYWSQDNHDEVMLSDRFHHVLSSGNGAEANSLRVRTTIDRMMQAFHTKYPRTVRKSPGIETVLQRLYGRIKMGVVSNFFLPGYPQRLLSEQKIDHYFDFIIDSAQIMVKKPGKQIYEHALGLANIKDDQRNRVLFVGDNYRNDVHAPRVLGMNAVHYDRSDSLQRKQTNIVGPTFKSWHQFESLLV